MIIGFLIFVIAYLRTNLTTSLTHGNIHKGMQTLLKDNYEVINLKKLRSMPAAITMHAMELLLWIS